MTSTAERVSRAASRQTLSEDGIALQVSEKYKDTLRYVATRGQWYWWDDTRWRPEETYRVYDLCREECRRLADAAKSKKFKSAGTVAGVERMARADRRQAALAATFDVDPWLLNCPNGTVDLRTGQIKPHDPADYITKITACELADEFSTAPLFDQFLTTIFAGDKDLISFVQRFLGYCLTGITREHAFVFGYGDGMNGKSTLTELVSWIMDSYAIQSNSAVFTATKSERHLTEVAKLHQARLVTAQEIAEGSAWNETRIKAMTGGDKIAARFMRQDEFEFYPIFKLFMAGNHMPTLDNVGLAMQRRLMLVPFNVTIPTKDRDPDLPAKLRTEGPAILRWLVDGCLEWQRMGLVPPKAVTEATDGYFAEQDVVARWAEECTQKPAAQFNITLTGVLYASFCNWASRQGAHPRDTKWFAHQMRRLGYKASERTRKGKGYYGIEIIPAS